MSALLPLIAQGGFGDRRTGGGVGWLVDDLLAAALADDETEMTQLSELVGDGGGLHADRVGELADRARPLLQPAEDLHTAGSREDLHALGDQTRGLGIERTGVGCALDSMTHPHVC